MNNERKEKIVNLAVDGISTYVESHVSKAFDEGYNFGYNKAYTDGYNDGTEKSHNAILKLFDISKTGNNGGVESLTKMFGYNTVTSILEHYTLDEIIVKINDFTNQGVREDSSIHVGDEVKYMKDTMIVTSVVSRPSGIFVYCLCESDGITMTLPYGILKKTGKHFDDLKKFLNGSVENK